MREERIQAYVAETLTMCSQMLDGMEMLMHVLTHDVMHMVPMHTHTRMMLMCMHMMMMCMMMMREQQVAQGDATAQGMLDRLQGEKVMQLMQLVDLKHVMHVMRLLDEMQLMQVRQKE